MKGRLSGAPIVFALGAAGAGAVLVAAIAFGNDAGVDFTTQMTVIVAAFPVVAASAFLAARRPVWAVTAAFGLMAFSGALAANMSVQTRPLVWVLLLGLVAATIAGYLNSGRRAAIVIWPGVIALGAYLLFSALQIPFAETTEIGARAFAAGPALMVGFFALAYAQWSPATRWRMAQGFVVVALLAGLYALYRLFVGPSGAEETIARNSAGVAGDLALFGSFPGRLELGAWSAIAIPALFTLALAMRGRWRWVAAAAAALMIVALIGSEVRTALIGAGLGIAVAAVLFQLARAFRGQAGSALLALAALAFAGLVGFGLTVGSDAESTARFERIATPGEDYSFQQRVQKWDAALEGINEEPLGEGLGTTGITQRKYSRVFRLDNRYIDNSYLQLGVQQGYPGWILFGLAVLLTGYMLLRSSLVTDDKRLAALGVGAATSLLTYLVILLTGDMLTSWGALLIWMLLGLGAGGFLSRPYELAPGKPWT